MFKRETLGVPNVRWRACEQAGGGASGGRVKEGLFARGGRGIKEGAYGNLCCSRFGGLKEDEGSLQGGGEHVGRGTRRSGNNWGNGGCAC